MRERGRPTVEVVLSDEERELLERWARRPKSAQALALRCRIVLACAEGASNVEVAARLGITDATVSKWRRRFVARGLDGLHDEPRPGAPRTVSDAQVERVIVKTLEETPADATHWFIWQPPALVRKNQAGRISSNIMLLKQAIYVAAHWMQASGDWSSPAHLRSSETPGSVMPSSRPPPRLNRFRYMPRPKRLRFSCFTD